MRLSFAFLCILLSLSYLLPTEAYAQAGFQKGKEYLLVDSVEYDSLSVNDRFVLDSLLPVYHKAKHDTARLRILAIIPEYINDESVWPKYNSLLYELSSRHFNDSLSLDKKELKAYKKF